MSTDFERQSKKQQAILNAARKLFVSHGIRRITVEEICRTADASKMTFYRFYKNKNDIAIAVIDQIADRLIERLQTIMNQKMSFGDKVKAMITARAETTDQFSKHFFKDVLDDASEVGVHLLKRRKDSLRKIKELFLREQQDGDISDDFNVGFAIIMAEYFRVFMKDERLQNLFPTPTELGKAINDFYLYGIIGKPSGEQNEDQSIL